VAVEPLAREMGVTKGSFYAHFSSRARVNGARVDRLVATYRDLGLGKRQARHRARIAYATYVGLLQMARESPKSRMKPAEREEFLSELRSRLIDGS